MRLTPYFLIPAAAATAAGFAAPEAAALRSIALNLEPDPSFAFAIIFSSLKPFLQPHKLCRASYLPREGPSPLWLIGLFAFATFLFFFFNFFFFKPFLKKPFFFKFFWAPFIDTSSFPAEVLFPESWPLGSP